MGSVEIKMTDTEINVAIAEACGWEKETTNGMDYTYPNFWDWCNDLNAMNEAEKVLSASDKRFHLKYIHWLHITAADNGWGNYAAAHATARQRAEAFLRTLGRWKE